MSRLFNALREKNLPAKYPTAEFKIVLEKDKKDITQADLATAELSVQVFNSEYIKRNLKWDTEESLDAISFDVGANVDIRNQITANLNRIDIINGTEELKGRVSTHQPAIDSFTEFENQKFKLEASRIKNDVFNSLIEFDKSHLKKLLPIVISSLDAHIIKNAVDLQAIRQTALAINNKSTIDEIDFSAAYYDLENTVQELLAEEPAQGSIIKLLQDDDVLYEWAKEGLHLHEENDIKKCAFCDNAIKKERLELLKNYFSNADAELRERIDVCREDIESEIEYLDDIGIPSSKNDFADKFQEKFEEQLKNYSEVKKKYISLLKKLPKELDRKIKGNLFKKIILSEIDVDAVAKIEDWVKKTNKIIALHNKFIENFQAEQSEAREKLKKHHVASFLKAEDYTGKSIKKKYAENCIRRYQCLVQKISHKNLELEGQLKSIVAGQQELNKFIKVFLNRDDVKIDVTAEDKFILKRGTDIAFNLSEGEKTAIAFAYFLVSLESLHKEGKLKDQIVFIDDPISSLDANHIAQVYSLINSFFFRKGLNANDANAISNCFAQLFISTHNFEFFSFLRDSSQMNRKKKINGEDGKIEQVPSCEYFLVKRVTKDQSEILSMPNSIKSYKSEYVYLFDIIYNFHKNGCKEDDEKFILMPNALRRFLEVYTLMKLPHTRDEFENRVTELVGEAHQLKFLNHFSHFTTFEKMTKHDELIMNLPYACQELIDLLEKDPGHYESLKRAINAN